MAIGLRRPGRGQHGPDRRLHRRRRQPELVTASELQQRLARGPRRRGAQPHRAAAAVRCCSKQVLDALIDERVLRDPRRARAARDRSMPSSTVPSPTSRSQNQHDAAAAARAAAPGGHRLRRSSATASATRCSIERVREREVVSRIKISDAEIDALIDKRRNAAGASAQLDIAQISGDACRDGAAATVVAERRARAQAALARVRGGEDFAAVAREISERQQPRRRRRRSGMRAGRSPARRCSSARCGRCSRAQIAAELLRSGAGFHVLKLVDRQESKSRSRSISRAARHILLRPSPELAPEAAARRLDAVQARHPRRHADLRAARRARLEDAQRGAGRRLGWAAAGTFVPEFEEAISRAVGRRHLRSGDDALRRAPDPGRSTGARSRSTTKQLREQARNMLREQKFEDAFCRMAARSARRAPTSSCAIRRSSGGAARAARHAQKRFGQHFLVDPAVIDAHRRARSIRGRAKRWSRSVPGAAR